MSYNPEEFKGVSTLVRVGATVMMSCCLLVFSDLAFSSAPNNSIQVQSNTLTAQLTNVSLRTVLDQLSFQLGIEYVASEAELEEVLSVELNNEPLSSALSKILAPWDYALTKNSGGNLRTLYIMPKTPSDPLPMEKMAKRSHSPSIKMKDTGFQKSGSGEQMVNFKREKGQASRSMTSNQPSTSLLEDFSTTTSEEIPQAVAATMKITPVQSGNSMQILPADGKGMNITPSSSAGAMEIIPPTGYAPMEIQPVPEHLQQEMLQGLNP